MLSVLKPLTLTPWRKTKRASCPATKNNLPYNEIIGYHIDRRVSTLLNKFVLAKCPLELDGNFDKESIGRMSIFKFNRVNPVE